MVTILKTIFRILRYSLIQLFAGLWGKSLNQTESECTIIIAPHPDDEVFGAGGLIADSIQRGRKIHVVLLTKGEGSHRTCCDLDGAEVGRAREQLVYQATSILGLSNEDITFLGWLDGELPYLGSSEFGRVSDKLSGILSAWKPDRIFCPHPFEGWADHEAAQELTEAAIGQWSGACKLYYYCVWFWFSMPFRKALFCDWRNASLLDISHVALRKQQAIDVYIRAVAPCGKPWSGVLPKEFLRAFRWKRELYFKVDQGIDKNVRL